MKHPCQKEYFMKKIFVLAIAIIALAFTACDDGYKDPISDGDEEHAHPYNELPTDLFSFPGIVYPVEMYYGADLGKSPPAF